MTGRDAYEMALALLNERDGKGEYFSDTGDFEKNAPRLMSLALSRLWQDDCVVKGISPDRHSYCPERVTTLDFELPLHEATCTLLPYLLACLLIREEDRERSEFLRSVFLDEEYRLISTFKKACHTSVVDVYK